MTIRDLLRKESIRLNGTATGKNDLLDKMVALIEKGGNIAYLET